MNFVILCVIVTGHGVFCLIPVILTGHGFRFKTREVEWIVFFVPVLVFHLSGGCTTNIAFKAFESIQCARKTIMVTVSRIIPSVWSTLWTYSPQDPNQSKSNKSKKDPADPVACSISYIISFNFPRSINPSAEYGVGHRSDISLLS